MIGRSCNSQDASSTKCSSLHDKYAGERSTRVYDPQTLRSYENAEAELEEVKHRIDRRFLNALLEETSRGLRTYGSFDEVERRLKLVVREKGDEEELLVSVEGKNGRLVELKGLLDDRSKDEDVRDVKVAEDRLSQLRNAYEVMYIHF